MKLHLLPLSKQKFDIFKSIISFLQTSGNAELSLATPVASAPRNRGQSSQPKFDTMSSILKRWFESSSQFAVVKLECTLLSISFPIRVLGQLDYIYLCSCVYSCVFTCVRVSLATCVLVKAFAPVRCVLIIWLKLRPALTSSWKSSNRK